MSVSSPVDKDSPLWLAWLSYVASEEYANSKRWAVTPEHTEGSLWAAFSAGFDAKTIAPAAAVEPVRETPRLTDQEIANDARFARGVLDRGNTSTPLSGPEVLVVVAKTIQKYQRELTALRSALSAAQKDSERLDWLMSEVCKVDSVEIVDNVNGREGFSIYGMGGPDEPSCGLTLRDAIDDGIKATNEGLAMYEKWKSDAARSSSPVTGTPKHPDCVALMCGQRDCGKPGPCYVSVP